MSPALRGPGVPSQYPQLEAAALGLCHKFLEELARVGSGCVLDACAEQHNLSQQVRAGGSGGSGGLRGVRDLRRAQRGPGGLGLLGGLVTLGGFRAFGILVAFGVSRTSGG